MRCGLSVTVFEALGRDRRPKFNAHVIVVMPNADARDRLIESLLSSSVYGGHVFAEPIYDWGRLTKYLCKEATPQAWFGAGKRIRESIPLGELGGDRVVLSRDLRDLLIATGRIASFQRTYAKRQPPPSPQTIAHHRAQSHTADRPPLEATPTLASAHAAIHGPAAEPGVRAQPEASGENGVGYGRLYRFADATCWRWLCGASRCPHPRHPPPVRRGAIRPAASLSTTPAATRRNGGLRP
jgi:hypothetical protein